MDHLSIQSLADAFAKKDAEIHRLNMVIGILEAAAKRDVALITELCDALSSCNPGWPNYWKDLIQRAREDTRCQP